MTDDERNDLFDAAFNLANWPCLTCGAYYSPYSLIEVQVAGMPTRWLCWDCLHQLFAGEEPIP